MYKRSSELKAQALNSLKGKWGTAVFMVLAIGLIAAPSTTLTSSERFSGLLSIIINLLYIILNVGYTSFILKICCGQKEQAGFADLFYGFKCHPGKAILLYLLTILYLLPGAFIFGIVVAVLLILGISSANIGALPYNFTYQDLSNIDFSFLGGMAVIAIVCVILYAIYAIYIETKYGIVYLLLLDYPDLSVTQIWKRSGQLMKGNKWRMFCLTLSFLPVLLISSIVFVLLSIIPVIGMIACIPYIIIVVIIAIHKSTAEVEFYLDLMQNQPRSTSEADIPVQTMGTANASNEDGLTHDCEDTHGNSFEHRETDYSGIDKDSFK